jgi:hypothetical protein
MCVAVAQGVYLPGSALCAASARRLHGNGCPNSEQTMLRLQQAASQVQHF